MSEAHMGPSLTDGPHDRRLLANVHPPEWQNPEPAERYHLVVVGAGTAGLVSASIAAGFGAKVALVERHLMGGDCLNVGCVPSKGVIRAARAWHEVAHAHETFGAPKPSSGSGDFAAVMERMRELRADLSKVDAADRFRDLGIDVFFGHGSFVAADAVEVDGQRLRFRRAVIATGARAAAPQIPGLDDVDYLTNESIFDLETAPRRFGILGGGPIGCEMAQAFARLGSEVHLWDRARHVLVREDSDAARIVQAAMHRDGVELHLEARVAEVRRQDDGVAVVAETGGERSEIRVDRLLVAVGRAPNTDDLGLEAAGVEYDEHGVDVDDRQRTTNKRIYAAGDIASRFKFTHAADAQARIVIRNAFFFGRGKASRLVVPWTTYTSPEIAHVGHYEESARDDGYEVDTLTVPLDDVDRAVLDGQDEGFLRIHLEKGSDRILGGTLVAAHAGDMLGPLALAITHELGLAKLSDTIFPYPTQGEVYRRIADRYRRRQLTPRVKKLMELWFKVFR